MKMGRNHHFNFGVQQQISPSTVLEVNYVGNVGRYLNGTSNINIPQPGPGGVQARRPFPQYGNILYFDTNVQNTYHSLQTTLTRRASRGSGTCCPPRGRRASPRRIVGGNTCFNVTNTPSFNAPATAIDTATAGRVTSTLSTPRQFQFGVKFNF
jgi:hypothetical protein